MNTPWQRVLAKFGLSQSELAREIGCGRSKVHKKIRDEHGLIDGRDQVLLLEAAKRRRVKLTAADLLPRVE